MTKKDKKISPKIWGATRITLGLVFLWAFFDKLLGLGYATCRNAETDTVEVLCDSAWLAGGSPTFGFLKFGSSGPFADFYQGLASTNPHAIVNWLFMLGLLGIGVALLFGIGMRLAALSGTLLMIMMWSASLWPANNPFIDDHIVYALVIIGLYYSNGDQAFGFGKRWADTSLVEKFPYLK